MLLDKRSVKLKGLSLGQIRDSFAYHSIAELM